jgi:hypothetical protein
MRLRTRTGRAREFHWSGCVRDVPIGECGQVAARETHGIDNMVTLADSFVEFGAGRADLLKPVRIAAVDVFPFPPCRLALEANVGKRRPILLGGSISERAAIEVDDLAFGPNP